MYSHVGYDGFGRKAWDTPGPVSIASANDIPDNQRKWYSYDVGGRLTKVVMPAVDTITGVCPVYRYFYDAYGNQIAIVDPLGRVTRFVYNELNLLTQRYQPFAPDPALSDDATTADVVALDLSGKPFEGMEYDSSGRIYRQTDCNGQVTIYEYYKTEDFQSGSEFFGRPGQLKWKQYYTSNPIEPLHWDSRTVYFYDRLGRDKSQAIQDSWNNPTAVTTSTSNEYDAEGRMTRILSTEGEIHYDYSPVTGLKTATWTGTNITTATTKTDYTYDELGRLYTVQVVRRNGAAVTENATTYTYNDNGSRGSVLLPNGVCTQYQYNAMNRLTEVVNFQTQPTLADPNKPQLSRFLYGHYASGQRATAWERQKPVNNVEKLVICRYDGLNRLNYESHYEVDSTGYGYRAEYAYDLVGNRLGRQINVVNSSHPTEPGEILSTEYTEYDTGDRLRKERDLSSAIFTALGSGDTNRIYAYADGKGGFGYMLSGRDGRIGQLGAFWRGLPSVWNRVTLILLAALLPLAAFGPMLAQQWRRIRGTVMDGPRPTLSLYHRCLCVLLAYIFMIGPETFVQLANAEVNYGTLSTQAWGHAGDYKTYYYDANGSLTYTIYSDVLTSGDPAAIVAADSTLKYDRNEYNLQNRLSKVTRYSVTGSTTTRLITEYAYNPDGIRVGSNSYRLVNSDPTKMDHTSTSYLIDPYNPTGYAQVLEEWTGGTTPAVTYTIGDDVIGQSVGTTVSYLLYDGHGSTRQLTNHPVPPTLPTVSDNFSYDAYGMMLGSSSAPNPAQTAATKYLYAGEQYDPALGHYYLRARYYNPSNGRFNQTDPFAGNPSDPQSLHKYLYAHCNPVNNSDPTGKFISMCISGLNAMIIRSMVFVMTTPVIMNTLSITMGFFAVLSLYAFATDPEAVDVFVASCGGNLTMASGILAMDIMAIRNMASTISGMMRTAPSTVSAAKNVINLKWNGNGSLRDFWRKAHRLQEAAWNRGLVYVGATDDLRSLGGSKAQAAYRKAVSSRLKSFYIYRGMSENQAEEQVAKTMKRVQADHSIDLQVSGALKNPNSTNNMHMIDSTTNGSVGKQIELECKRLGLTPGDLIDEITIDAPTSP